jgi:hypothetical protein
MPRSASFKKIKVKHKIPVLIDIILPKHDNTVKQACHKSYTSYDMSQKL